MMEGEFESMKAIYETCPDFAPRPVAWGTFKNDPNMHFFIGDYLELDLDLPDMHKFCSAFANMHLTSQSPNGKYGFHVTTYNGSLSQINDWTDSWEDYYATALRGMLDHERNARGPSKELDELTPALFEKVIPRLLRPLETGGRSIKPSLVHGDMWHGNAATNEQTDAPVVFDAAAFYGHHEYDTRAMVNPFYKFGREYLDCYQLHNPVSDPRDDFEDRMTLYKMFEDLTYHLVRLNRFIANKYQAAP